MNSGNPAIETLADGVTRVQAPNPSPMTYLGTNTYIVGTKDVLIIDPGPENQTHLEAVLSTVPKDGQVAGILVTHPHLDHSAGTTQLAKATGAQVHAFGTARAGRSYDMDQLAAQYQLQGGEGLDDHFEPDLNILHGDMLEFGETRLEAVHTPGHLSSHLCFVDHDRELVFTGDHVMGWSSTLISPPDGSVSQFMRSIEALLDIPHQLYLPGHGAPVSAGHELARTQFEHRKLREKQILVALGSNDATLSELAASIYVDTPKHLHKAAERNVLAHLIDLAERGMVELPEDDILGQTFKLI